MSLKEIQHECSKHNFTISFDKEHVIISQGIRKKKFCFVHDGVPMTDIIIYGENNKRYCLNLNNGYNEIYTHNENGKIVNLTGEEQNDVVYKTMHING